MNHVFRVVWSASANTFIAVNEYAKSCTKGPRATRRNNQKNALSLMLIASLLLCPISNAATRFWDANGTAVGSGGAGTWNLASALWSANNDGVSGPYGAWSNGALDDAVFSGVAGTITLGLPINVHNLTFQTTGYTLNGSTLTLGGTTPTITVGTLASDSVTIGSILAGNAGLTKSGLGTLNLTGTNTFSGDINLSAGRLSIASDASLGALGNAIRMANGSRLDSVASLAGRTITLISGVANLFGAGAGAARLTGAGGVNLLGGSLTNNANDYTGITNFSSVDGTRSFSSIADLGVTSALGAPTTVANGTIFFGAAGGGLTFLNYTGSGNSSNRNWQMAPAGPSSPLRFGNLGTGTLTLTGNIALAGASMNGVSFDANTADLRLLGVISSNNNRPVGFLGGIARTITLGDLNTYTSGTGITGVTVQAGSLKNTGVVSSLGTGTVTGITINGNGALSYTGSGDSTDRAFVLSNGAVRNDGTGSLLLSGNLALTTNGTLGGDFTGADNTASGVISGTSSLTKSGAGTWNLSGANTFTGNTIVNGGTLRANNAQAFGVMNAAVVNGGVLDLNSFNTILPSLAGTGGSVALGSSTLTLNGIASVNTSYAGNITGSGGLTKLGLSTQTLSGTNTYTGATTVNGGNLNLDFRVGGASLSNIIAGASTLNMGGANLNVTGANGVANSQTFNGLTINSGNNRLYAASGTGGSMTVNLGSITRTGGVIDFGLPSSGNITTSNTTLGGWATVNGTDYAKVVAGNITAFTLADYVQKDNAATWLPNDIITDTNGFFGTVGTSVQIGGLRYTRPVATTVTVANGQTLGVDGTIIVAPTVAAFSQTLTGGSVTGTLGGGSLGVLQSSTGNFTIGSQIVDNSGSIGFTKAGTGLVTLSNSNNTYTGATLVTEGTLSVNTIADGGLASSIGTSSAAPSNLTLQNSTLQYTGASASSNRGFTIARAAGVAVTNAATNLNFSGQVTSSENASFTKTGAGTLTLSHAGNDYTGATTVSGGVLAVSSLANGGQASGIGASGSESTNLVLDGGALRYLGGTTSSNRGFTLGTGGGAVDVSSAPSTLTMSGAAVGSGSLTKQGSGTLLLSGTNTYTGGSVVNAGTLQAGSTQAFGTGGVTLANTSGATLNLNGFNNTVAFLAGGGVNGGNVALGPGTLTLNGTGAATYSGVISGTGGLIRAAAAGVATQTLTGCNNSYTGGTSIIGSTLSVDCLANGGVNSGIGASSNASANLTLNNGTLNYTGNNVATDRGVTLVGTASRIGVINPASTLQFSGPVVGASLQKTGAGTLVLSGANTYSGNSNVLAGTLRAGSNTAFGVGGMTLANTAGVLLDLAGFNTSQTFLSGGGTAGGNVALGSATLTLTNPPGAIYSGAISGSGGLIKNGAGQQTLAGCNSSYSGPTSINAGVLAVNCLNDGASNSSIGSSSAAASNLLINGGTLQYVGTGSSSDRLFTLGTAGGTLDASGTGTLVLTNSNPIVMAGTNIARTLTLTGTNTGNNRLNAQLTNNGSGVISLTKSGTGTWELDHAASTYTGTTTINGGVLSVAHLADGGQSSSLGASSGAAANLVIGNGSTLRYVGSGDSSNRLFTLAPGTTFIESSGSGALNLSNIGAVTLSGTNTARTIALGGTNTGNNILGGTIGNNGNGATTLAKNDSGTWVLTGNNTFTGNTVINNGNLMIGNGGTSGNAGSGNVIIDSASSTLSINRSNDFAFDGTLSGPGTLTQIGTGTTTLTSSNNAVGTTRIDAGTLDVDGSLTTASLSMNGSSTLSVAGSVQAAGANATLLSGDGGGSTVNVDAGGVLLANGDMGDGSDAINLAGTLNTGLVSLSLGAGDDTLTLNDGALLTGLGIDGGAAVGTDTLRVNNATALTFDGTVVSGFERLRKTNVGTLTTIGNQLFSAGTEIDAGTLEVDGTLETPTISLADGATLNVDGTVQAAGATPTLLSGSTGTNTVLVNSGAVLRANGDLGDGQDSVTLGGTLDTSAGALNLGAADDTFTLNDGALISGVGVDAGTALNSDLLVLNNGLGLTFDSGQTTGFEQLLKQSTGIATMTGTQSFDSGVTILEGGLEVDGILTTPTVSLFDNTSLTVDGVMQGQGGTSSLIFGSTGVNTLTINGLAQANGNLGAGNDVLDVAGVLDTGALSVELGDGDDTLTIHDGTSILGTVSAGAGTDTFNTHIVTSAELGAVQGFETLSKTGGGELDITGPLSSDFTRVEVLEGRLDVSVNGSVTAAAGSELDTLVASGATLNVEGNYGCGAGNDRMTVAGTVSGGGTIDLCDGDDTLTLNDGAVLNQTISGGTGTADVLQLDNANALSVNVGSVTNFELLQKDNVGAATLLGTQSFSASTTLNGGTLSVAGQIDTPTLVMADNTTLQVDGALGAAGASALQLTGSAGVNTITVGASGTLRAMGDLGAGDDVLDVLGTLDAGLGGNFLLGDGDDTFVVHDGTTVIGTISGGAGHDTQVYDLAGTANIDAVVAFEGLSKRGLGTLNLTGPATSELSAVVVEAGRLDVQAGASVIAQAGSSLDTEVRNGATLNVDGNWTGSAFSDHLDVAGMVSGSGTVDLADGGDTLTLRDGADLSALDSAIDGGAGSDLLLADIAGSATLGAATNFEVLTKSNVGTLNIAGPALSDFVTVAVEGGMLNLAPQGSVEGVVTTTVSAGAQLNVDGHYGGSTGNDSLTVSGFVSGNGDIALGDGDDVLTLNDGADLNGFSGPLDGGAHSAGDQVVLNNGSALSIGANLLNFENLNKRNVGVATLTGAQTFSGRTTIEEGTLQVDGSLTTPVIDMTNTSGTTTLTVNGAVNAAGGTPLLLTGSSGANNVLIDAAGILRATGDLGAGDDVLDVLGTLDAGLGGNLLLGDGNDTFIVHDGTTVIGTVSGGAGLDTQVYDLAGTANVDAVVAFEGLTKRGLGTLNLTGPATSELSAVVVEAGVLDVQAGASVIAQAGAALDTQVRNGATLNVDGSWTASDLSDSLDVAGILSGTGSFNLADGNDSLTLRDGANLSALANAIDGGAGSDLLLADIAGSATLNAATNFETLTKSNIGTLNINGPALSDFTTVAVDGGTLNLAPQGSVEGVVTTTVSTGAQLNVDGHYGGSTGDDSLTVSGVVSGNGDIALGDGDDVLTLNDGADLSGFTGPLDGGAHNVGDRVVLNNASALSLGANLINFESLQKDNLGAATLSGVQVFSSGTTINAGTLQVDGSLLTPVLDMTNTTGTTTLLVNGTVQAAGAAPLLLTGSAGVNTVTINSAGVLRATGDLGDGNDTLDVGGTLDAGNGSVSLGDGDDTLVLHDATTVIGTISGGAGLDTRIYDLAGTGTVGALLQFEGLTKRGGGTLSLTGPAHSELVNVIVESGTLDIQAGSSVVAQTGSALNADVWSGATLIVDGSWTGSDQSDRLDIAGTLSGSGMLDLAAGDDTLILHDGANLTGLVNPIDGGAHTPAGDRVVLDVASQLTLDGSKIVNFEQLEKQGAGTATLTGAQGWSQVSLGEGTLALGSLSTPSAFVADTLDMADNTQLLLATGSTAGGNTVPALAINGSSGTNTVSVAEDATLNATGDLGEGDDILDVAGTLNIPGVFNLGAGDDTFKVYDTTIVTGTLDAGAGNDTLNTNVSAAHTATLGGLDGFESLGKSGEGTLQLTGSSTFIDTTISAGTLEITGDVATQTATLESGARLLLTGGQLNGTAGADTFDLAGRVEGTGSIDLAAGDDALTLHDGADLSGLATALAGGEGVDTLDADLATQATLGRTTNFEVLNKSGDGTLTLSGPGASDFATLNIDAGTLSVSADAAVIAQAGSALNTLIAHGATLAVDGEFGCGAGNDSLQVSGAIRGSGSIDLCAGDDSLTLNDGADLSGLTGHIEGGTNTSAGDTLVLNTTEALTLDAGTVTGFEVLHKLNAGEVTLTGNQSYSLKTLIDGGQLNVDGRLTSASVEIASASTLAGSGTIAGSVFNAGTLAPGAGLGTLTVEGNVTFAPGSVFAVDIEPGGASDHLNATGVVTINGGTVDVASAAGTYEPGKKWTLISAAGGVSGAFDQAQFSLPFLDLSLGYDLNNVFLEVERNDTSLTDLAVTPNELSVASGLASLNQDAPLLGTVLNLPDADTVRNAYNQLSGEIHSSLFGTLLDDSRLIRQATLNRTCNAQEEHDDIRSEDDRRLQTCTPMVEDQAGNVTIWGQALSSYATTDSTSNTAEVKRDVTGLYLGGDLPVADNWRVGLVTGYENRSVDVNERQSSASVHSYHVGAYANGQYGAVGVHLGAIHTQHEVDTKRRVSLADNRQTLDADYDVATNQVFVELAYKTRAQGVELEPFAGLAYVDQGGDDAFQESGGTAALAGDDSSDSLTYSTLGVRGAAIIGHVGHATVSATGSVAWQRLLNDYTPERSVQLAGSSEFKIEGAPIERNSVPVEAGVAIDFNTDARLSMGYRGQFSSGYADHGVIASLSIPF